MATVQQWTGREARALRRALRMSVRGFAAYLGAGVRTVASWEAEGVDVCPRPELQAALDTALRRADQEVRDRFAAAVQPTDVTAAPRLTGSVARSDGQLCRDGRWDEDDTDALAGFLADDHELDPGTADRLSREWRVVAPPQVVQLRAGRGVGVRLAHLVTERADVLRRMDDLVGGRGLYDLVRRELQVTLDLMRGAAYTEKVGRALLSAVGELCQLAGWVAGDAGRYGSAQRYYLGGVSAAHAARDVPLAANLLSSLSYQVANVGDAREAVLLARSAYGGAVHTATPAVRTLLLERVAWAEARFGDARATRRALDAADDTFAECGTEREPAWAYWLSRVEIDVMAGRCFTELRQPGPAIALLTGALTGYDETHARELALYLSWLAEAHVHAGDPEQAAAHATRALRSGADVSSARTLARMQRVRSLLAPYGIALD